jgi:hypothetical protein
LLREKDLPLGSFEGYEFESPVLAQGSKKIPSFPRHAFLGVIEFKLIMHFNICGLPL